MTPNNNAHVMAVAFPFGTHAAPLLTVVRRLASASPSTKFSFISTSTTTTDNLNKSIRAYSVWDGVDHSKPKPESEPERIKLFMTAAPQSLKRTIEAAEAEAGRKVSCLITDAFFWFGGQMAQDIGVPWLPFWTASPTSLLAHIYTDVIRDKLSSSSTTSNTNLIQPGLKLSFIPGMSKLSAQDLPQGIILGDLDSFFSHMLRDMGIMLPRATTLLLNSFPGLVDDNILQLLKSKFNNLLHLGPLNLVAPSPPPTALDETPCLLWLDAQEAPSSVAYIGLGSVAVPSIEELAAIAQGLESSGVPFIWSLRDNAKVNLPQGFLDSIKEQGLLLPWAPQPQILSHRAVGVFVTHGGWNSVLESIAGGVPMICRPFFGDQMLNGRVIQDVWEVGVMVEDGVFTKEGVVKCLDFVLSQEKGKRMKEKIKTLRDLAMEATSPRGSSTENFKLLKEIITTTPA